MWTKELYWRSCGVFFEGGRTGTAWIHGFTPTFAQIAADRPRTGLMGQNHKGVSSTFVNPIIKPVKNVAIAWKNIPILSPIPSLILETSLKEQC